MISRARAPRREIIGWAMFDFANSAYTTLIITVVFGDLFTRVIVGDAPDYRLGNLLWSLALAASYLLVVLSSPLVGAIIDHTAAKKDFLFASYLLTLVTTAALYWAAPGLVWLGMLLLVLSNFAFSIGESFIASFLPSLGPPGDLGKISGFGWGLGYIGGLLSTLFVLLVLGEVSAENFEHIRWVGPWTAVFFLVAAIPTFLWLREPGRPSPLPPDVGYLRLGMDRVRQTLIHLDRHRDLGALLIAVFFAMGGISIVIAYAFIYGAQVIGWDESVRGIMFVVVQLTAAAGALGFGVLQDRIGALRTYRMTLALWIAAILLIYLTPEISRLARTALGLEWSAQYVFLAVGCVAGASLGACQSSTRALVGLFAPQARAAELFGFWGLAMKLAGVFALIGVGLLQAVFGLHKALLFCVLLFAAALLATRWIDEARGRAVAAEHDAGRSHWELRSAHRAEPGRRSGGVFQWRPNDQGRLSHPQIWKQHRQQPEQWQEGAGTVDAVDAPMIGGETQEGGGNAGEPEGEPEEETGHGADASGNQLLRIDQDRRKGGGQQEADEHDQSRRGTQSHIGQHQGEGGGPQDGDPDHLAPSDPVADGSAEQGAGRDREEIVEEMELRLLHTDTVPVDQIKDQEAGDTGRVEELGEHETQQYRQCPAHLSARQPRRLGRGQQLGTPMLVAIPEADAGEDQHRQERRQ